MAGGRPPKLFTREDCDKLGIELVQWVKNSPKAIMWVEWYEPKGLFRGDWEALVQRDEFLGYYNIARHILTRNMMLNKDLPQSYGNRYLSLYDNSLRAHEKEIKEEEVKMKEAATKPFDQGAFDLVKAFLSKPLEKDKEA